MNVTPFSPWFDISDLLDAVLPEGPLVVQAKVSVGLVVYPLGQSAMVFYGWALSSDLRRLLADFPDAATHRFRFRVEAAAAEVLASLLDRFATRFGALPRLNEVAR